MGPEKRKTQKLAQMMIRESKVSFRKQDATKKLNYLCYDWFESIGPKPSSGQT